MCRNGVEDRRFASFVRENAKIRAADLARRLVIRPSRDSIREKARCHWFLTHLKFPADFPLRAEGISGRIAKKNLHFTVRDSRKCFDSRFSGSHRGRISRGLTWSESRFRPGQRPIETDRRKVARPRIPRSKARPRSGTRGRLAAAVGGPGQRNVRLTSQEFCDPRTKAHFPFFLSRTGPPLRS